MQHPVTYFPIATQRQLELNRALVQDKPYAHLFDDRLWLHSDVLPALSAPIDRAHVLPFEPTALNRLLEPGYLEAENGYCELADGGGYTASLVDFPGCSGEMLTWWMWWHAMEPARYTLWYPHNHICAVPQLARDALLRRQGAARYVGVTHHVDEYIGPHLQHIAIDFVEAAAFGFDVARFASAGIVAHACAYVRLRHSGILGAKMVHLARQTATGFELRSRYWIAHEVELVYGPVHIPVDFIARGLGLKRRMAAGAMAYEQLLHDQTEFTHLSTFLERAYAEFGQSG